MCAGSPSYVFRLDGLMSEQGSKYSNKYTVAVSVPIQLFCCCAVSPTTYYIGTGIRGPFSTERPIQFHRKAHYSRVPRLNRIWDIAFGTTNTDYRATQSQQKPQQHSMSYTLSSSLVVVVKVVVFPGLHKKDFKY